MKTAIILLALILPLLRPAAAAAATGNFRLLFIGSLSGYVKLCG